MRGSLGYKFGHTGDLANGSSQVIVTAPGFTGAADARVTITGTVASITDAADQKAAREAYLAKTLDAFWVDGVAFGTAWTGYWVLGSSAGSARAGGGERHRVRRGSDGPGRGVQRAHRVGHERIRRRLAYRQGHYVGLTAEDAAIASLDAIGMNMKVT